MSSLEAKALAQWLERKGEGLSVSREVREAIYILSPQHAPVPRLRIEDLLLQIRSGPLAEEDSLEEDLDLKSMQNLLQSQPLPKLGIDDILSVVQSGPLAEEVSPPAQVIPFYRRPAGGVVGVLLAAAVALLFFVPSADDLVLSYSEPQSMKRSVEPALKESSVVSKERVWSENEEPAEERARPSVLPEKAKKRSKAGLNKRAKRKEIQKNRLAKPSATKPSALGPLESSEKAEPLPNLKELPPAPEEVRRRTKDVSLRSLAHSIPKESLSKEQRGKIERAKGEGRLEALMQDSDLQVAFEAAYQLGKKSPSQIGTIENFLRLKGGSAQQRKRLYALLGDLYRKKGNTKKSEEYYRKAIQLP